MARVFQKRGAWWLDYMDDSGRRHREPVGLGASYSLAKEVLAKRLAHISERRHFPSRAANAATFNSLADKFWELHGQRLKSKSWASMLVRIRKEFGTRRVSDVRPSDIQKFYNALAGQTSVSTANRHLTLICSIFSKAKLWGLFYGDNPVGAVKREKEPAHRLRFLSMEEWERLYEAAHERLKPVLICAVKTGMRKSEIINLGWENVDLEHGVIYILQSKSGRPREIHIASSLRECLLALGPKASGPVFALPEIMLRRYFDQAVRASRVKDFCFHDLRHTFASHYIMKTNDLPALQKALGHSTPAMTLRYAHLSQGHMASNMAAFDSAIPVKRLFPHSQLAPGMAPSVSDEREILVKSVVK